MRREFIEAVIGAYQSGDPENRTVFVSTHLISEFEGLIDKFTIIEQGRELLTMDADDARDRFKKIRVRFRRSAAETGLARRIASETQTGREAGNSGQRQQRTIDGRTACEISSRRNCAANRCRWRKFLSCQTF